MTSVSPSPNGPASAVAAELRRRRELLGISQVEAARRTGVSRTEINLIESGRRVPSIRTYERLRSGLGLVAPVSILIPPPLQHDLAEEQLATLAACLCIRHATSLAHLAVTLHLSIAAVREGVLRIADRLAAVGLRAVDDGVEVRLVLLPFAARAVSAVTTTELLGELSTDQIAILCTVASRGVATCEEIEELRGQDSESLLQRLITLGLLHTAAGITSHRGATVYRITAKALAATGHATPEAFQADLARALALSLPAAASDDPDPEGWLADVPSPATEWPPRVGVPELVARR